MGCCMGKHEEPPNGDRVPPRRNPAVPTFVQERNCTDMPMLSVFVLYWCFMVSFWAILWSVFLAVCDFQCHTLWSTWSMKRSYDKIVITVFAFIHGDPYRLIYGTDSFGNVCGKQNNQYLYAENSGRDMSNKPYLFAMDIIRPAESLWICVSECPIMDLYNRERLYEYADRRNVGYCSYDVPYAEYRNERKYPSSTVGPCPVRTVYESSPLLNWCVPKVASAIGTNAITAIFGAINAMDTFKLALADVAKVWLQIVMLCVLSLVVAILVVFLIRFAAGLVVYIIFIVSMITALAISGLLWYGYYRLHTDLDTKQHSPVVDERMMLLVQDTNNEHALIIYAIVATVITIVLIGAVICMWSSASLIMDLFSHASKAMRAMPCLLMQPLWTFLTLMLIFVYWLFVVLLLGTAQQPSGTYRNMTGRAVSENGAIAQGLVQFLVVGYDRPSFVRYFWWVHTIGCIWTAEFVIACQQMVVAGSVAIWYFTRDKATFTYPICQAYKQLCGAHLGSVALGSFIITLVKLPRLILMYFYRKIKESKVPCVQNLAKCCICCMYCIERCLRYLHHNAYTVIAIEGKSFCPAAKQALETLAGNPIYVASINSVGDFVLFLAKLSVVAVAGIVAAFIFTNTPDVHFWAVPFAIVCVFAYLVAHCFFTVYEMAIDTLYLCFAEDQDLSDSTGDAMYADEGMKDFMSRTLERQRKESRGRDPNVIELSPAPPPPDGKRVVHRPVRV